MNVMGLYSALCFFLLGLCAGRFVNTFIYRIPLGEFFTGIVWSCAYLSLGFSLYLVLFCLFSSALILAAGIDRKHLYIPDRIPAFITVLALISIVWGSKTSVFYSPRLASRLLGGGVISLFMLAVSAVSHGGIGG